MITPRTPAAAETAARIAPNSRQRFLQRVLPFVGLAILLALIPLTGPSRSSYTLLNAICVNAIFALSYNMLLGRGGMLSFGHAVYFGLGAYGAMWAMRAIGEGAGLWAHIPVFALPIFGFMAGAIAGTVIGYPSCRRAGVAFAMISLGVAELVAAMGLMFPSIFGGEAGVSADRMSGPEIPGLNLGPVSGVYIFTAVWTLVGAVAIYAFTRTPLGRLTEATRDNPERVQFVGFDPLRVRYMGFIVASGFAGLAGGMSAVNYEIITPDALSVVPSGFVLLMAYVGGIRYFAGPMIGAALLTWMQSNLSDFSHGWMLYLGLMFIAIVMFAPGGLAGIIAGLLRGLRHDGARALARFAGQTAGWAMVLCATIVLTEAAMRHTDGYGEVFAPFGIALPFAGVLTWTLIAGLGLAGIVLLRRLGLDREGGTT